MDRSPAIDGQVLHSTLLGAAVRGDRNSFRIALERVAHRLAAPEREVMSGLLCWMVSRRFSDLVESIDLEVFEHMGQDDAESSVFEIARLLFARAAGRTGEPH